MPWGNKRTFLCTRPFINDHIEGISLLFCHGSDGNNCSYECRIIFAAVILSGHFIHLILWNIFVFIAFMTSLIHIPHPILILMCCACSILMVAVVFFGPFDMFAPLTSALADSVLTVHMSKVNILSLIALGLCFKFLWILK